MHAGEFVDTVADYLAIFVLTILICLFWMVHILPQKIAERRGHPQADAIKTLCLMSLMFGGLLWPLAYAEGARGAGRDVESALASEARLGEPPRYLAAVLAPDLDRVRWAGCGSRRRDRSPAPAADAGTDSSAPSSI